jgi:hypothetical protein
MSRRAAAIWVASLAVGASLGFAAAGSAGVSRVKYEPRAFDASKNEVSVETLELLGTLTSKHNLTGCSAGVPVKLQRREHGAWVQIGKTRTDSAGKFSFRIVKRPKAHRFVAPRVTVHSGKDQVFCRPVVLGFDKGYLSVG